MFVIWGGNLADEAQFVDAQSLRDSVITPNKSIARRIRAPTYDLYRTHWRSESEFHRRYWAASLLLPIGTIFVLALVVLLMVLFKRCPQMVAAVVASILGLIIIFTTLVSINHTPIYS